MTDITVIKYMFDEIVKKYDKTTEKYEETIKTLNHKNEENILLKKDLLDTSMRCQALEIQLHGRDTISAKEEKYFPVWLRDEDLSRSQKWTIALSFNVCARAVWLKRKLPRSLAPRDVGLIIEKLFNQWPETFSHKGKVNSPENDVDWELIFKYMNVYLNDEKLVIKFLAKDDDYDEICRIYYNMSKTQRKLTLIDNINENASDKEILDFFKSQNVDIGFYIERLFDTSEPQKLTSRAVISVDNSHVHKFQEVIPEIPSTLITPNKHIEIIWQYSTGQEKLI